MGRLTAPEQRWTLTESRQHQGYLLAIHGLALIACWLNDLATAYQAWVALAVLFSLGWQWQRIRRYLPLTIRCLSGDNWLLNAEPVSILRSSLMTTRLSLLHVEKTDGQRQVLSIFRDSLATDDYRRLLVAVKIATHKQQTLSTTLCKP